MADKQAKLAAALKKRPSDADYDSRPPPPQPTAESASASQLKLRKSNLLGVVTWEECMAQLDVNGKHDLEQCVETLKKMLGNVLANPAEAKFRKIRVGNPAFQARVYSCKGAPALFKLCGFKDNVEEGQLVLADTADLAPLQKALDQLAALVATRAAAEERKRTEQQQKDAAARAARAQRAQEETAPAAYDAAVAANAAMMVDEDEAMVDAIEEYMDANPDLKQGRPLDSYAVERQVAGPGGMVVASVAASVGTDYFDYVCHMRRSDGRWVVSKVEAA